MDILMVNYEFPPVGGGGGVATYNISKELVKLGNNVDIITTKFRNQKTQETVNGINVHRVKALRKHIHHVSNMEMLSFVSSAIPKALKLSNKNKYDLVHATFAVPSGIVAWFLKKIKGKNYGITFQGSDVPGHNPTQFVLSHKLIKLFNRSIWKNASFITAVSPHLIELAKKLEPKLDIQFISNGVDITKFRPNKNKKNGKQLKLLSVGRLLKRKSFHHVIKIISELKKEINKEIIYYIAGKGPEEEELKILVKKLGLNKEVVFLSALFGEELINIYQNSDVFILPSMAEGTSLAMLEAMACGLPIIASDAGAAKLIVTKKSGILYNYGDIEKLKESILETANTKKRIKMGEESRKLAEKKYRWKKITQEYIKMYNI